MQAAVALHRCRHSNESSHSLRVPGFLGKGGPPACDAETASFPKASFGVLFPSRYPLNSRHSINYSVPHSKSAKSASAVTFSTPRKMRDDPIHEFCERDDD